MGRIADWIQDLGYNQENSFFMLNPSFIVVICNRVFARMNAYVMRKFYKTLITCSSCLPNSMVILNRTL